MAVIEVLLFGTNDIVPLGVAVICINDTGSPSASVAFTINVLVVFCKTLALVVVITGAEFSGLIVMIAGADV